MDELKPCPFCGGDAELTRDTKTGYDHDRQGCYDIPIVFVECVVCGARGHDVDTTFAGEDRAKLWAVNAWNLRKIG